MFFKNKPKKNDPKCSNCKSRIGEEYSFCPYCGNILFDPEKRSQDFGMLGKNNAMDDSLFRQKITENNLSITDKMISSIVSSLMKNLDQQMRGAEKSNISSMPRNIKIKIGVQPLQNNKQQRRAPRHDFSISKISEQQLQKMSSLPKTQAKTNIKRLGNKVIYELDTPGIESVRDIFVSKLESGYEIKALAKNKVYVNSLPVNLPINSFTLDKDRLFIEFSDFEE